MLHILKLFTLLITISCALEYAFDFGLNTLKGSIYEEWSSIANGKINAEVIILGSSRGVVGYDSEIIENHLNRSTYNLSFDAASYNLQQVKLNSYLSVNKTPSIIIQNVDLAHFSKSSFIPFEKQFITTINESNIFNIYNSFPNTIEKFRFKGVTKFTIDSRLLKLSLSNLLDLDPEYTIKIKGYKAVDKYYKPDDYNLKRIKEISDVEHINFLVPEIRSVFDFYNDKRFENTKIYMVWAPEFKERRDLIKIVSSEIKSIIRSEVDSTNKIEFIDFQNDLIGNDSINFYDTFHLNSKGSKKFTNLLKHQLDFNF